MKRFFLFAFSCLTLSLVLLACGTSGNNNNVAAPACPAGMIWNGAQCQHQLGLGNGFGTCSIAGHIQTQQGCLPPCAAQPGFGQLPTGACLPPMMNGMNGMNGGFPGATFPNAGFPGTMPYGYGNGYNNCRMQQNWGMYYWYCGF